MISGSLARRYAKALLSLALEEQSHEATARQLDELARVFASSAELQQALTDPVFPLAERRAVLEALCARAGASRVVRNFVMLLLDRGRIGALPDIGREFGAMVDAHAGRVRARVTSARPLAPEQEARLRALLEQRMGKKVILEKHEDPSLLGGVVAEVGDLLLDGSLKYHMENLRKQLEEG
jgi:F-type H+-transporting ATPase subunit delta